MRRAYSAASAGGALVKDEDADDNDDDETPPPPPPPEGSPILTELARAAVLAMRAECPALLLAICAQLRNTFDSLPRGRGAFFAYKAFEPMPRLSQADDKDPPADIPPELWKPPLRAAEALIALTAQLRDGGSIGGRPVHSRSLSRRKTRPRPRVRLAAVTAQILVKSPPM